MAPTSSECVRVAVRCRPLNERERAERQAEVVAVDAAAAQVVLRAAGGEAPRAFTFDRTFGPEATQAEVYDAMAAPLVESALAGYNATLFAFGQTGTGKTHTMEGITAGGSGSASAAPPELPAAAGIIPRAFRHIFAAIGASADQTFLVRASMLEIYQEEVRDLLAKNPTARLELHEAKDGGVYVKGLNTFVVKSEAEIAAVLEVGKRNRSVGATLMNQDSSRSHSVFTITIEAAAAAGSSDVGGSGGNGGSIRVGKLHLVDLAGSERQGKTGAAGERLKEASKINLSLSALGNVISALVDGKSGFVPYRDSKLTRLLQDSLGGNTRTVMIANVGPAASNGEETLSTLRYANRAKNIRNKPRVNEDPKDAMLREFQEEIERLKAELAAGGSGGSSLGGSSSSSSSDAAADAAAELSEEEVARMRQQLEEDLRAEYSSGGAELDAATLEQIRQEVEVQLASQLHEAEVERRRAMREAAKLGQQVQQQTAHVQQAAQRKAQVAACNSELASKLKLLEGKLLRGEQQGGLDRLAQQAAAQLSWQQAELRKQRAAEAEAAQRIAALEANAQAVQTHTMTLQEEAAAVTSQLEAAVGEHEAARAELGDVLQAWQHDREELAEQIRALHYNLALKTLVIDAFIPQEEVSKLMRRMTYNVEDGSWSLRSDAAPAPTRAGQGSAMRRPASARQPGSRFRATGPVLFLDADTPQLRSLDFGGMPWALA
ncbi:kinesin KIF3B [Chlorella sorokiniana]|uniref:Kinesin-like protein n=1 Tax=Chlorella sorokiniana TaxID=3076 RepID=A0A2P6TDH7_CHLSO|nr:kinesin KIF3B [Chlorella sorokiniana]|eukprot:PRW20706.1 kinesin KIF3B [Chlorella sorokiniana]